MYDEEMQGLGKGGGKGKPENPGDRGKGHKYGKNKVGVCVFRQDEGKYAFKMLPLPAANNAINQGRGVAAADASVCEGLNEALVPASEEE